VVRTFDSYLKKLSTGNMSFRYCRSIDIVIKISNFIFKKSKRSTSICIIPIEQEITHKYDGEKVPNFLHACIHTHILVTVVIN